MLYLSGASHTIKKAEAKTATRKATEAHAKKPVVKKTAAKRMTADAQEKMKIENEKLKARVKELEKILKDSVKAYNKVLSK